MQWVIYWSEKLLLLESSTFFKPRYWFYKVVIIRNTGHIGGAATGIVVPCFESLTNFWPKKRSNEYFKGWIIELPGWQGGGEELNDPPCITISSKIVPKAFLTGLLWAILIFYRLFDQNFRERLKKLGKYGQADGFMLTPPPKLSGKCEIFSTSCHIWGYLPFHKGQHFSQIVSVKLGQPDHLSVLRNFGVSIIFRSLVAALHGVYYSSNQIDKHPML